MPPALSHPANILLGQATFYFRASTPSLNVSRKKERNASKRGFQGIRPFESIDAIITTRVTTRLLCVLYSVRSSLPTFFKAQMRASMRLTLPIPIQDGIRVGICVVIFLGLGLGLSSRLVHDPYLSDFLEFCSWQVPRLCIPNHDVQALIL
jgi:hypothetical protein